MKDIAALVEFLGGMAQKQQLVSRGARDIDLTAAVRTKSVLRVRNGWYTTLTEGDPQVLAVRVGGRLTGISAVQALGGWVLEGHPLHVSLQCNAARLRTKRNRYRRLTPPARGVVLHWDNPELRGRGNSVMVALRDALVTVIADESRETAIAALDWALQGTSIDMFDIEEVMLRAPVSKRFGTSWLDANCESLPESLSRTRLREAGYSVVSQVPLMTGEKIDLVLNGIVGLEVDGDEFHRDYFERDRRKDAQIFIEGFIPFRASAKMVFHEWAIVRASVEAAIMSRASPVDVGNSGIQPETKPRVRGRTRE